TELLNDVQACLQSCMAARSSQFDRRNLVRSSFAAVEGLTWALKVAALRVHDTGSVQFDEGEVAILSERRFDLGDDGNVRRAYAQIPIKKNLRFAWRAFAKANKVDVTLDCGSPWWKDFGEAKKIRDRLVHPKSTSDLYVTEAEVQTMNRALVWWASELGRL